MKTPEPLPPRTTQVGIRLAEDVKAKAVLAARDERRSLSQWIEGLILDAIAKKTDDLRDLRSSLIAFAAPWAGMYAKERGLPPHHLDPTHYDILARAGARMDDFIRGEEIKQ